MKRLVCDCCGEVYNEAELDGTLKCPDYTCEYGQLKDWEDTNHQVAALNRLTCNLRILIDVISEK